MARKRVDAVDCLNLIVKEEQSVALATKCRHNVDCLALYAESCGCELNLCAGIECINKTV